MLRFTSLLLLAALPAAAGAIQDWSESTPRSVGLNAKALARLDEHIRAKLPHVRSLLIARHGKLVFEQYYGDVSRDTLQNVQSMSKSLSSALIGIALKKHRIASLDVKVLDYFADHREAISDPRMKDVTIRHLLTMSSGLDEMGLSFDKSLEDPIRIILRQKLLFDPGNGFRYSSPAAHLLGAVLRRATHQPVLDFAQEELLRPLGIDRITWYADNRGLQSGGLSALVRARDMLTFGELYLRRGVWKGAALIPEAFVAESTQEHNAGLFYGEPARYGYLWFITNRGFYARGYGGQYLMVIPGADMVILCTSDWKQPEYPDHFALVDSYILPAIDGR